MAAYSTAAVPLPALCYVYAEKVMAYVARREPNVNCETWAGPRPRRAELGRCESCRGVLGLYGGAGFRLTCLILDVVQHSGPRSWEPYCSG